MQLTSQYEGELRFGIGANLYKCDQSEFPVYASIRALKASLVRGGRVGPIDGASSLFTGEMTVEVDSQFARSMSLLGVSKRTR
jgi:hypothetical protein